MDTNESSSPVMQSKNNADKIHSIFLNQHTTFFCPGGRAHTNPFTVTIVSNWMLPIWRLISGRWKRRYNT